MNRAELQQLTEDRLLDAESLLAAGRWSAAYYLAGYAIECALKSCILAYVERTGIIFEDRRFLEKCWTHDLESLVAAARLQAEHGRWIAANAAFAGCWSTVKDWSEASRYVRTSEVMARELYQAISHDPDGVLKWIKTYW